MNLERKLILTLLLVCACQTIAWPQTTQNGSATATPAPQEKTGGTYGKANKENIKCFVALP